MSHSRRGRGRDDDQQFETIFDSENCVCDVVRAIADAQDDVLDNTCDVSCLRSINNLVSPVTQNSLDTIPIILYGRDLQPFRGFGAQIDMVGGTPVFDCTESFIFRVKEVSDDEDECCAVLELLTINPDVGTTSVGAGDEVDDDGAEDAVTPCDQLNDEDVADLRRTGICITVDLKCFCAVTCLPAVSLF